MVIVVKSDVLDTLGFPTWFTTCVTVPLRGLHTQCFAYADWIITISLKCGKCVNLIMMGGGVCVCGCAVSEMRQGSLTLTKMLMGLSCMHWPIPAFRLAPLQADATPRFQKISSDVTMHPLSSYLSHSFSFQKYRVDMPGSNSAFIPTINAITTSQDLQWMVQPTVITSMSNPYSRSHPYGHHLTNGPGLLGHNTLARPGVIRSIGDARGRRKRDEQVRDLGWQCGHNRVAKRPLRDFFFQ